MKKKKRKKMDNFTLKPKNPQLLKRERSTHKENTNSDAEGEKLYISETIIITRVRYMYVLKIVDT